MDEFNKRRFFARGATNATRILSNLLRNDERIFLYRDSILQLMAHVVDATRPEVKR